ncbi:MAG: asparagine--tRNA ligase, partial [Candidatus Heimdallarchaeota archaeon]|nr:asparagine--tRNA ligase [Candidatus Heimdallarchaeota archaeon]
MDNIKDLYKKYKNLSEKKVIISGWIRTIRVSKAIGFIEVNDGSLFKNVQIVFEDIKIDNFSKISKYGVGAAVTVEGTIVLTPEARQSFEINASKIILEGQSDNDYPLQKKRHSFEFLRTIAHLRPRTNTFSAVFRIRSLASYAIHKFFQDKGFIYVQTPIITGSDCEGAGEMFRVTTLDGENPPLNDEGKVDYTQDFFGKETNLTVSGQLEGETF